MTDRIHSCQRSQLAFFVAIALILELVHIAHDQSLLLSAVHVSCFALFLIVSAFLSFLPLGMFILLLYEAFETAAWLTLNSNITWQIFTACDLAYVWNSHPEFLLWGLIGVALAVGLVFLPTCWPWRAKLSCPKQHLYFVIFLFLAAFFPFVISFLDSLYPFNDIFIVRGEMPELHKRITRSFTDTPRLVSLPPFLKNLIVIQVESFERIPIGYYNSRFPENMPFLSSLVRNHTVADNIDSQPYTTWTASGTFLAHCGYPQIIRDPLYWENRKHSHITALNRIPCYPTFLKLAGYDMYSYAERSVIIMGVKQFFEDRGYEAKDGSNTGVKHDWDLFDYCGKILPKLLNNSKPFVLHILTEDTHPMYYVDPRCHSANLLPGKEYPPIIRSFNCLDQSVQRFVELCKALGLEKNTEIVIHSDHVSQGNQEGIYDSRKLIVLFPFRPPRRITKPSTYYDLPPTILDILGVQYSPPFPFGASLFSNAVGVFPKDRDFQFMHNLYSGYTGQSCNISCAGKAGFCTGIM
jgi:hypothetical protein